MASHLGGFRRPAAKASDDRGHGQAQEGYGGQGGEEVGPGIQGRARKIP
ncbi:MAG: hypothetical protein LBP92_00040 [Deltaproteobacteria bacterium]|nr:hypothetical protein [Deltaproteobacteria bacterium]